MPKIVDTHQQTEWKFANALTKFLPQNMEWSSNMIGYPVLYQKGFWGFFKGQIADLTGDTIVNIKRPEWRATLLEALTKYETAKGVTINVRFDF